MYVQAFPQPKGRWMVSNGGGLQPVWRADGRELFYLSGGAVVAVGVTADDNISFGTPQPLFSVNIKTAGSSGYAIGDNGERILTNELPPVDPSKIGARLIQNWTTVLSR